MIALHLFRIRRNQEAPRKFQWYIYERKTTVARQAGSLTWRLSFFDKLFQLHGPPGPRIVSNFRPCLFSPVLIFARAYFRPCFCPKHKRKHIDFSFPKFLITHSYSFLHADSSLSIDRESCVSDTHHGKVDSNFRAKRVAVVVGDEASEKIDDVFQELKFAQTLGFATLRSKTYRVRVP